MNHRLHVPRAKRFEVLNAIVIVVSKYYPTISVQELGGGADKWSKLLMFVNDMHRGEPGDDLRPAAKGGEDLIPH